MEEIINRYKIIIIAILIVFIGILTVVIISNYKVNNITKDYNKLKDTYDSLKVVTDEERLIIEDKLEDLSGTLKTTRKNLTYIERKNKENESKRLELEKEITKYRKQREDDKQKIYTPDELDNRLISILRGNN